MVEKTTEDKNFNFITGMGIALEAFEKQVLDLNTGDSLNSLLVQQRLTVRETRTMCSNWRKKFSLVMVSSI